MNGAYLGQRATPAPAEIDLQNQFDSIRCAGPSLRNSLPLAALLRTQMRRTHPYHFATRPQVATTTHQGLQT
jgi:hypothetical protein